MDKSSYNGTDVEQISNEINVIVSENNYIK